MPVAIDVRFIGFWLGFMGLRFIENQRNLRRPSA